MKGFTFIELILVLAIILILAAISVAFYSRFLTQNAVINNTDQIVSILRKAQTYSMMGKQNGGVWGVRFTASPKEITLYLSGNSAYDEDFTVNNNITIGSFTQLEFAHLTGLPINGNPSNTPTITVTGNNQSKSVSVNSQGVVNRN